MYQNGLVQAIRYFGSQQALATELNVSQRVISHWLNREGGIPFQCAIKIYLASKGAIPLNHLAPQEKKINKIIEVSLAPLLQSDSIEG